MRRRAAVGVLGLIVVASVASTFVRLRTPPARPPDTARPSRPAATPAPAAAPSLPPLDPASVRDVFRFGDEGPARPEGGTVGRQASPEPAAGEPAGPRLVGLVRRSGRLLAALDVDGEIELAAQGESVAGVTVLAVSEDAVRIRGADGQETVLPY